MSKRDTRTPEQREAEERSERWVAEEARLDEVLTRRHVLDAIESISHDYERRGDHDGDLICNALRALAGALS